ncbi:MAG: hypothetical protein ACK4GT_11535 [Pararhodobacter sp.]
MRALALACLLIWLVPLAAVANPWPREAGRGFLASSTTLDATAGWAQLRTETYAEYGFRPRLTLGGALAFAGDLERADVFLRWHPRDLPMGLVWGLTSGLRYVPTAGLPVQVFSGVDLGRGFDTAAGNLWLRSGARIYRGYGEMGTALAAELNAQVGLRRGRWLGYLETTHFQTEWTSRTRLRPALGVEIGPVTLLIEAILPPGGAVEQVRLGVWSGF